MAVLTLAEAKAFLDVIHDGDDAKLQLLLDGAEDEALRFLDREDASDWAAGAPDSVKVGVLLLLQASYQAAPVEAAAFRQAAEYKLMPYRQNLGV